jgi:hypothetical protein
MEEVIVRRTIITALLAALTLAPTLVAPAAAEPPDPNHHVIDVVGRRLVAYAPFGNQELARASPPPRASWSTPTTTG